MQTTPISTPEAVAQFDKPKMPSEAMSEHIFDPSQCLFCRSTSLTLETNITHMFKAHGFMIPEQNRLLVDLETFITYLHLVISHDFECLHCGAQRGSGEAVRQHMVAKGHCKIDITDPDSELLDFYGTGSPDTEISETPASSQNANSVTSAVQQLDDTTLLLSSGKVLFHKDYRPRQYRRRRSPEPSNPAIVVGTSPLDPADTSEEPHPDRNTDSLTRVERRAAALDKRMVQLRATDARSLSHLPLSQQRAQLMVQAKQMDSVRRAQKVMESRVQREGNRTLMKTFTNDGPGPNLNYYHMF